MDSAFPQCPICLADIVDTERQAFPCSHLLHAERFDEYRTTMAVPSEDLKCPTRKTSAKMLQTLENSLMTAGTPSVPVDPDRQPDTVIIDDTPSEPVGADVQPNTDFADFGPDRQPDSPEQPVWAVEVPPPPSAVAAQVVDPVSVLEASPPPAPAEEPAVPKTPAVAPPAASASPGAPSSLGRSDSQVVDGPTIGGSFFPKFREPTVYCATCGNERVLSVVGILTK